MTKRTTHKEKYSKKRDKIIVTAALLYANGPVHIGHMLEYVQTDIFVRFLRLLGKDAHYICASDMHGTPIEIKAQQENLSAREFALKYHNLNKETFKKYLVGFANYYHTDSKENKELSEFFFRELKKKGFIHTKKIKIVYCENCRRSLPDRFVKGKCPHCKAEDQYGDVCEKCSSILKGINLIEPYCSICENKPIQKESEHYFFKLSAFSSQLEKWINSKEADIQPEVRNWLHDWLRKGLDDWCISRDAPYFGFEIPNSKKELGEIKYFYVWLDAPIGYISSTKNYCSKTQRKNSKQKEKWEDYWKKGQVYHIIGKDIAYFHYLFWPAMLMGVGIPVPKITTHGWVIVNGQKMSKSRGTFFTAEDFLKLYSPEALRFYYASHLDRKVVDVDLNFEDFKAVINNVLMGNLGNFCYRTLVFAQKNYGKVESIAKDAELVKEIRNLVTEVEKDFQALNFKGAMKGILRISDLGNAYFQKAEPWKDKESKKTKEAVGLCVNIARNLAILINPVLPEFSKKVFTALGEKEMAWNDISFAWKGKIKKVDRLVEKLPEEGEEVAETLIFPLKLAVGKITAVKDHPKADKLYLFKVDFGKEIGKKQVVAGLKEHFSPKGLQGKKTVFCLNLKPAKLRGELSEAMILVAEDDTGKLSFLDVPDAGKTAIGEEVKFEGLESSDKEVTFDEFQKLKMVVSKGKVMFKGKKLKSRIGDVSVDGAKEGARVR